jgi:hypothetical protein
MATHGVAGAFSTPYPAGIEAHQYLENSARFVGNFDCRGVYKSLFFDGHS